MIANKNRVLFLDIETAPLFYLKDVTQNTIPEPFRSAWKDRIKTMDLTTEKKEWEKIKADFIVENPSYFPTIKDEEETILNLSYNELV